MAVPLSHLPAPPPQRWHSSLFTSAKLRRVLPAISEPSQTAGRSGLSRICRLRPLRIGRLVFASPSWVLTAGLSRRPAGLISIRRLRLPRSRGTVFAVPRWILTARLSRGRAGLIWSGGSSPVRSWPTRPRPIWSSRLTGVVRWLTRTLRSRGLSIGRRAWPVWYSRPRGWRRRRARPVRGARLRRRCRSRAIRWISRTTPRAVYWTSRRPIVRRAITPVAAVPGPVGPHDRTRPVNLIRRAVGTSPPPPIAVVVVGMAPSPIPTPSAPSPGSVNNEQRTDSHPHAERDPRRSDHGG
jgi:hypothetical protein